MLHFSETSSSNVPIILAVSPRDKDEYSIWKKFVSKVTVDLAVVIQADADETVMKSKFKMIKGLPIGRSSRVIRPRSNR